MPSFGKRDGLYGVQIITGPTSVLLRLGISDQRIEDFEVAAYLTDGLFRNPGAATVRARVLEGADEANRQYGTSFYPRLARYAVEDYSNECHLLRRAAFAVVERLALCGNEGYEGLA